MTLLTVALGAQVLAAVSAVLLARRRVDHVPAAVALSLFALIGLTHAPLLAALMPFSVEPYQGLQRVLVYLDGAIAIAQYAIVAGLAVAVAASPQRRRLAVGAVVVVWALASVVLALLYPAPLVRGASLQRIYFDADLVGLFVATGALITEARADIVAKRSPTPASMVAVVFVLFDGGILLAPFSPWRNVLFGADFGGLQIMIAGAFTTIAIVQVLLWLRISRT